jgi:hypothetical protein
MTTPMVRITLIPADPQPGPSKVNSLKLTLVSPPFPKQGERLRYLGSEWIVTKAVKTKGMILPRAKAAGSTTT